MTTNPETLKRRERERKQRQRETERILAKGTNAEKRVVVAKDVLAQLRAERYIAQQGTYLGSPKIARALIPSIAGNNAQIQAAVEAESQCQACALGTLFLSAVRLCNNVTAGQYYDEGGNCGHRIGIEGYLSGRLGMFSKTQLALIEAAFERSYGFAIHMVSMDEARRAADLYRHVPDSNKRLALIMKNIVSNEGTFVVPDSD